MSKGVEGVSVDEAERIKRGWGVEVVPVRWGVCDRVGDRVFLNEKLCSDTYADLRGWMLGKQLGFGKGGGVKEVKEVMNDFWCVERRDLWLFMVMNPRTWVEIIPVSFREGNVLINFERIVTDILTIGVIGLFWWWLA